MTTVITGETDMPEVNYLAVIAAAVATFVLGGLWYPPRFSARRGSARPA